MDSSSIDLIYSLAGLFAGCSIGYVFGLVQDLAVRHNARLQKEGRLKSAWTVMPGSAGRVVALLLVLVLIQVVCPTFFRDGVQWWISGGVGAGYGVHLFLRLRQRLREMRG